MRWSLNMGVGESISTWNLNLGGVSVNKQTEFDLGVVVQLSALGWTRIPHLLVPPLGALNMVDTPTPEYKLQVLADTPASEFKLRMFTDTPVPGFLLTCPP